MKKRATKALWLGKPIPGGLYGTANFLPQEADAFYQLENQGAVSGQANTGGLFGCLVLSVDSQTRSIARVLAQRTVGSVNGTRSVGGLVGQFTLADRTATAQSLVADSMNLGQIEGESQVGGLVGTLPRIRCAENTALIQTSYHKGNVLAKTSVGTTGRGHAGGRAPCSITVLRLPGNRSQMPAP